MRKFVVVADAEDYLRVADDILRSGILHASYIDRGPGFPLLLALAKRATGDAVNVLWLVPLLAGSAAAATVVVAFHLSGSRGAAAACGLIFCLWPNHFQFSPLIMSDAIHAYLAVAAFALTVAWAATPRVSYALSAAALWAACQSIRPTFFPIAAILPILIIGRRPRAARWPAYAMLSSSLVIPILLSLSNYRHHGVFAPSTKFPEALAIHAVPRLEEEMGLGSFADLRADRWAKYERMDVKDRSAAQYADAATVLSAHPVSAVRSFTGELVEQMLSPLRPFYAYDLSALYSAWPSPPPWFLPLFWISAATGLIVVSFDDARVATFLLFLFAMVMVPAAAVHWVEGRCRFPVDLLSMPLATRAWLFVYESIRRGRRRPSLSPLCARRQTG